MFEWWVILTLISLFAAGFQAFFQKLGVINNYNSYLLNSFSALVSAIIGFILIFVYQDFGSFSWLLLLFAVLSGSISFISTNLRMESLKHIDTTISLPIHKFISPLFVLIFGLTIFNEPLSQLEWIGIALGMCVPLLLINNIENARQNNLKKGVLLIAISGLLSAVSFAVAKSGIDIISSIIVFFTVTQIFMTITGFILYKHQKPKQIEISPLRDSKFLRTILMSGVTQFFSFFCILVALDLGGNIAIVYTIQSLYIVIPIILSVFIFNEHINKRKIFVITTSIVAIILMK